MNHAEAPKESVVNIHEPRNTLTDLLAPMMDLAHLDDRRENYAVGNVKYLWKHLLRT